MSQSTTPPDPIGRRDGLREAVRLAEHRVAAANERVEAVRVAETAADERVEAVRAAKIAAADEADIARDNLRKCMEKLSEAEGAAMVCISSAEQHVHDGAGVTRSTVVELLVDGIPFTLTFERTSSRGEVRVEAGGVVQLFSSSSLALGDEAS